ncbi:MAG: polysaccharide export protein [Deltaproteobacteria bacterium]|nr:polysaccharide export protein [Deltaproteobacteria bacterium]
MKNYLTSMIIAVLFFALPIWAPGAQEEQPPKVAGPVTVQNNYIIGPGDVLDIALWRDDALVRQVTVLTDGNISFPLIGEVMAAGKTITQLKQEISAKLTEFVPDPVLSIEVKQPNSMIVYVIGRVNNQNRFPVSGNVTVLQALSIAGGLTPFASGNKIKIMREEKGKTLILPFKYDEVLQGKNVEQNITLKRGDVIVVP